MADLPIPMSAPMVRAILREIEAPGTGKTQTRRIINPQPEAGARFDGFDRDGQALFVKGCFYGKWRPRYRPGDRLYVREAVCFCSQMDKIKPSDLSRHEPRLYTADKTLYEPACMMLAPGKRRPPMFMPRWASRLTLIVTDVRVQRLHDCSEADALAEGIEKIGDGKFLPHRLAGYWSRTALLAYGRLWDEINGPGSLAQNPWVAAYTFRPVHVNIDQIPT